MKANFARFLALSMLALILLPRSQTFCQLYHLNGDANSDGWCNFADAVAIQDYLRGVTPCPNFSFSGADADGNAIVNGIDVTRLISYVKGFAALPVGASTCPIITCDVDQTAQINRIELREIPDGNPLTASYKVSIITSAAISVANFSFQYERGYIAQFAPANIQNANYSVHFNTINRTFSGSQDIMAVTFYCYTGGSGFSFPTLTWVFDLVLTKLGGPPVVNIKVVENDPIYGPPRFFFGTPGNNMSCGLIFPSSPLQLVGDVNCNDVVNGIDLTSLLNYFKGGSNPIGKWFWNLPVNWGFK